MKVKDLVNIIVGDVKIVIDIEDGAEVAFQGEFDLHGCPEYLLESEVHAITSGYAGMAIHI